MGLLGSVTSGIGSVASTLINNSAARNAASKQNAWNVENYQNRHQWETKDLEKAGLNRILSATNGAGAVNSAGQATVTGGDLGNAISAGMKVDVDAINAKTNADVGESQTELNNANSAKITSENKWIDKNAKAEIAKKQAETEKLRLENKYNDETFQARITQEFAKTEQEVLNGRLSVKSAKMLEQYGITREEAFQLGEAGLKAIANMIGAGMVGSAIKKAKTDIIQNKKEPYLSKKKHSAKQY